MKHAILIIVTLTILMSPVMAKKRMDGRIGRSDDHELRDKWSPSHVPYPYPQTRKEIIDDLKYAVRYMYGNRINSLRKSKGTLDMVFLKLMEDSSDIKIGRIIKIKNKIKNYYDDYSFLISINGKDGELFLQVSLYANGQIVGAAPSSPGYPLYPVRSKKEVMDFMEKQLHLKEKSIKIVRAEPILARATLPTYCSFAPPIWEMETSDGELYFFQHPYLRHPKPQIYKKKSQMPAEETEAFNKKALEYARIPGEEVLFDDDKQTLYILKKIK